MIDNVSRGARDESGGAAIFSIKKNFALRHPLRPLREMFLAANETRAAVRRFFQL